MKYKIVEVSDMPLSMVEVGQKVSVMRVGGTPAIKQRLADLGFVDKLAITKEMANKIVVKPLN